MPGGCPGCPGGSPLTGMMYASTPAIRVLLRGLVRPSGRRFLLLRMEARERLREPRPRAEFPALPGGAGQFLRGNFLPLRHAQLLVERPGVLYGGFYPLFSHGVLPAPSRRLRARRERHAC